MTLVLDENGKEVHLGSNDNVIKDADDASWLLDNATIVYLSEVIKPKVLFSFRYLNRTAGPTGHVFEGRTFLSFVPAQGSNLAFAVERDRNLSGPRVCSVWNFSLRTTANSPRSMATKAVCLFLRVEQKSPTTSIAKYWKFAT